MTDLSCREVSAFLLDYLDHGLGPEERAAFEAHLRHCDECVLYLRQYEAAVRLGRAALEDGGEHAIPEGLVQAILAARRR